MNRAVDVWYKIKNILTSPAHIGFVAIAAALGMMQAARAGWTACISIMRASPICLKTT